MFIDISIYKAQVCTIKYTYTFLKFAFWSLSLLYSTGSISGAGSGDLFRSDEIIHLELRSDFTAIQIDRTGNPQYNDGELIYYVPGGETLRFTVRIIARGNFRRMPENCSFPPLFINFKKKEVNNTIFDGQDKLKLVTPCQDEADVIEEYTVCKMYNRVTDLSFRVRLAKILYYDSSIGKKLFESYSYFIEDKDHVAEMNNCYEYIKFMTPFDLDKENYMKLSFF